MQIQARTLGSPIHPLILSLKHLKMSVASNDSDETVRPSSAQRRGFKSDIKESNAQDDPTELMDKLSVEPKEYPDLGKPGTRFYAQFTEAEILSTTDPIPSNSSRDKLKAIRVSMKNYLEPVYWNMSRALNPLFSSNAEKEAIQRGSDQRGAKNSDFWVHSLRYEPSVAEPEIYRTVQIDNIPREVGIQTVLREVCLGMIESIQLVDIPYVKPIRGQARLPHKFARIVFVKEKYADRFQRYAHDKPLEMGGKQVRVYVQMEPTYPRSAELSDIIYQMGLSRIMSVFGLNDELRDELPEFLMRSGLGLVRLEERDHDGVTEYSENSKCDQFDTKTVMEFRSVKDAHRAWEVMKDGGFKDAVDFMIEPDYCARIPEGYEVGDKMSRDE